MAHRHHAAVVGAHVLLIIALSVVLWAVHMSTGTALSMVAVIAVAYGVALAVVVRRARSRAAHHEERVRRNQAADEHGWGLPR